MELLIFFKTTIKLMNCCFSVMMGCLAPIKLQFLQMYYPFVTLILLPGRAQHIRVHQIAGEHHRPRGNT